MERVGLSEGKGGMRFVGNESFLCVPKIQRTRLNS